MLKGREPWSFRNGRKDADATLPVGDPACEPIEYPKPDGVLSFDLLSNLALSGVKHEHDQPAHLRVKGGMEAVASEVCFLSIIGFTRSKELFFSSGVVLWGWKTGGTAVGRTCFRVYRHVRSFDTACRFFLSTGPLFCCCREVRLIRACVGPRPQQEESSCHAIAALLAPNRKMARPTLPLFAFPPSGIVSEVRRSRTEVLPGGSLRVQHPRWRRGGEAEAGETNAFFFFFFFFIINRSHLLASKTKTIFSVACVQREKLRLFFRIWRNKMCVATE